MTCEHENKVTRRFFVGCQVFAELRMHLNQSIRWKHQKIEKDLQVKIHEAHYQGKDYLGLYIDQEHLTGPDLTHYKGLVIAEIKKLFPELSPQIAAELYRFFVFSQTFIA